MCIKFIGKLHKYWNEYLIFAMVGVFLMVFVFLNLIFFFAGGDPKVDDHYFHFKYAYLLRTDTIKAVTDFDWIYLTGLGVEGGRYPVSLFQVSLIPFTYFDNWMIGLQIADTFYASLVISLIYFILRKSKVRYPLFFSLILFSSTYFFDRVLAGRAFVLILAVTFLEMYFAVEKKYKALFLTVLFHVLWHQSTYFMPLVIVGIVEAGRFIALQKVYFKNIFFTIVAIIVGMMFFPGFPNSLISWLKGIFNIQSDVTAVGESISGGELATRGFSEYFLNKEIFLFFIIFCIVGTLALFVAQVRKKKVFYDYPNKKHFIWIYGLFLLMISTIYGSIFVSGRLFDFLVPAVFVLSAFLITIFYNSSESKIDNFWDKCIKITIILFFCIIISNRIINIQKEIEKFSYDSSQKTAQWIKEKSDAKNDKVFLHNWSTFPLMFFENSDNVYSTGIEPRALKEYDEELYWKYYNFFKHNYYCEEQMDCALDAKALEQSSDNSANYHVTKADKENGKKIIESIKNEFDAKFIVSSDPLFVNFILLNLDLVESYAAFSEDDITSEYVYYSVFKLK